MDDWTYAGLFVSGVATVALYARNSRLRDAVDQAVKPLKVPERRLGYSADDLAVFKDTASRLSTISGKSALDLYRNTVLGIDIGFAVSLALFGFLCWHIAEQQFQSFLLLSIAPFCQMAAFIYGVFDVAEDITLRILLRPDRSIRGHDAGIASTFTLLKMLSLTASVVGGVVFLGLVFLFKKR